MFDEILKKYPYEENCPFRLILNHFGNKWSMIVIVTLANNGELRFGQLDRKIKGISQKMLTSTLQALEKDGFVIRTVYQEIPPKVEYRLTPLGANLLPLIQNVADWVNIYSDEINESKTHK